MKNAVSCMKMSHVRACAITIMISLSGVFSRFVFLTQHHSYLTEKFDKKYCVHNQMNSIEKTRFFVTSVLLP